MRNVRSSSTACQLVLLSIIVAGVLWPGFALAGQDDGLAAILGKLEANFRTVKTVQAQFTQEKRLDVFDDVVVSTGVMMLRLPDANRWEYTAPIRSVMVLREGRAQLWHETTGKVETFRLDKDPTMKRVTDQVSGWLRADFVSMRNEYEIALLAPSPARLRLTPRDPGVREFIRAVEVEFAPDGRHMRQLTMYETGGAETDDAEGGATGDWTRYTFHNVRVNAPLPKDVFEPRPLAQANNAPGKTADR
jgi:outer membrane lipoprotein carrier protein